MAEGSHTDIASRSPHHPVRRALRWIAVLAVSTWFLWMLLAPRA